MTEEGSVEFGGGKAISQRIVVRHLTIKLEKSTDYKNWVQTTSVKPLRLHFAAMCASLFSPPLYTSRKTYDSYTAWLHLYTSNF